MSQTIGFDPAIARRWLGILHGDSPGHLLICSTDDWAGRAFRPDQLDQAVSYIAGLDAVGKEGIYLRVTSVSTPPEPGRRGSAADSAALPALWADLDLAGPGHKDAGELPPDETAGRAVIAASGLPEPTIWVHSGGGLYPIWLLDHAHPLDQHNLDDAKRLAKDWQRIIEHAAASLGWRYARGVGDLARVLRIPGTVNRKEGLARPCRIVGASPARYTFSQLQDALAAAIGRITPEPPPVNLSHSAPHTAPATVARPAGSVSPLDDYAARTGWDDILTPAGWHQHYEQDGVVYWTRPGKSTGTSASTNALGTDRLHVFTTSAAPLEGGESYSKGGTYAALYHGGDHSAAARELAGAGYGTPLPDPGTAHREALTDILGAPPPVPPPQTEITGGELPAPTQPLDVARALVTRMATPFGWWRGDFYRWTGTHWETVEDSVVENWLYRQTERAVFVHIDGNGDLKTKPWAPTKKKINDLGHALGIGALHREGEAEKVTATANGVLHISTAGRTLLPHTRDRFNLFSLPFAYDPGAACPGWMAFLESVLPDDDQAQDFLGEWFGYVLSGSTDQQKILALIGERRSGKGTIARILTAMLGRENVTGLDLNLLPGNFGLESLIGKSLAISGDVRWHSRSIGDAVPILLQVSGQDGVTAHRKNRTSWSGQMGVRFMLMSNDTPTFSDRSGALSGRMIYVKFAQSFYGREDVSLTDKLLGELPGILNWALDGLERLNGRGRFTEPISGLSEAEAARRLSDPIGAFIEDWCVIDPGREIGLDLLFTRYRHWCESEGRTKDTTTKEIFSRDLRSKIPALTVKRERVAGKQVRNLYGIGCDVTNVFENGPRPF